MLNAWRPPLPAMLIGAHVSSAGGPARALERAQRMGARSMQVFSQSPRAWRPTRYSDEQFKAYDQAAGSSPVAATVIHAVYLINCASTDSEIRPKSIAALTNALRIGDRLGAQAVVLHPGSSKGEPLDRAMELIADACHEALQDSQGCPLALENTAGAGYTIGRSFEELAQLVELIEARCAGHAARIGVCLDSCHLFASGYDLRSKALMASVVDDFDRKLGLERLRCLHLNDSITELGSNRDRHANLGEGVLGRAGVEAFLGEPRLQDLPVVLEVPGPEGKGPDQRQLGLAREWHDAAQRS